MAKELQPFTVTIVMDQPHESNCPTLEEFAAAMSGVALAAMMQAFGRGLPTPLDLTTDEEKGKAMVALLPGYRPGAAKIEYADGGKVTVHV
jgi:hypothetical protein